MDDNRQWHYFPEFAESALQVQIDQWSKEFPEMGILAFVAEASKDDVAALQTLCRSNNISLIGALFPALIAGSSFYNSGILLFLMPKMPGYFLHPEICPSTGGAELAEKAVELLGSDEGGTLFMIFDSMVPNISTLLDRIYLQLADSVGYAGVNAGSETFQPMPCLFDSERLVQNGLLAIWFRHASPALLEHGYSLPEQIITVTTSNGNCIETIDWRPAFEVYQELAREQYGLEITQENFYEFGVHFPFGIVRARGDVLVRIPVALTENGALYCVGEVPENSILTLLHGPADKLMEGVVRLSKKAANTGNSMFFYCAGRKMHLGDSSAAQELEHMSSEAGEQAGAVTLGEIGNFEAGGYPQFHNGTLVHFPWDPQ